MDSVEFQEQVTEGYRAVAKKLIDLRLVEIVGKPFSQRDAVQRESFGARLRGIRSEHGISSTELAQKVKRDPAQISRIETGKHPAPCRYLYQVSDVFGVPVYNLLVESGYLQPQLEKILEKKLAFELRLFEESVNSKAIIFNF